MKNACSRAGSVVAVLQGKMPRPAIRGVALSPSRGHTSERGEGRYGRSSIEREKVQGSGRGSMRSQSCGRYFLRTRGLGEKHLRGIAELVDFHSNEIAS